MERWESTRLFPKFIMMKKTWLIKRNAELNSSKYKTNKKGIQWYTQAAAFNELGSSRKPAGSSSRKGDVVYIYQTELGIWGKGKVISGCEDASNFHQFYNIRDVVTFSKTKAKYKNDSFWGNVILGKLFNKEDGKFTLSIFEAKLEIEILDRQISVHEKRIPTGQVSWSELKNGIEEIKTQKNELSEIIPPSLRHKLQIKFNKYQKEGLVLDIDHHVPKSIGGPGNIEENLVPLNPSINRYKGAKIPEGLFEVANGYPKEISKDEFKLLQKKQRDKLRIGKDYPFLEFKTAQQEARRIIEIVNSFEFEEAKKFYKKVRAKIYNI